VSIVDELRYQADQSHNSACILSRFDCTCRRDKRSRELMQDAATRIDDAMIELKAALGVLVPPDKVREYLNNAHRALMKRHV